MGYLMHFLDYVAVSRYISLFDRHWVHLAKFTQNYLVYTNTVLFINSGGDSRVAGFMLALGTVGVMVIGPVIIGYIPIMVVGALIFYLGLDLMREALVGTWKKVHRLEYLTVGPI